MERMPRRHRIEILIPNHERRNPVRQTTMGILLRTVLCLCGLAISGRAAQGYRNFKVAVYIRAQEVRQMKDPAWLESRWKTVSDNVHVDKVYIETHRDTLMPDRETVAAVKAFFKERGVAVAGGITFTRNERNRFETFCYTDAEQRRKAKEIAEFTASLFDEFILDDFFFTSCKCPSCIRAKGRRSWTRFRLDVMDDAARNLVIGPARAVNPKVRVVIKYPNWYEHFQGLGFDLENEPKWFDGIYTGTETRDRAVTQQHLQPYESYEIFRFFENIKPGGNLGGWVDTGAILDLDRYAEQLWGTLFAKAPEITLFDFRQMISPVRRELRAPWQGQGTSFDFDAMTASAAAGPDGTRPADVPYALAAGFSLARVDSVLGLLGRPAGVKAYKPFHSLGDDFLHNYLGTAGIPMELMPAFPSGAGPVFLAESAAADPAIVDRIKERLGNGGEVIITSGLLKTLQTRGIRDVVELETSDRKVLASDFVAGWFERGSSATPILFPQIGYLTNDSWESVSFLSGGTGWPLLHEAGYAKGRLWVLAVPDNPADLYALPAVALNRIRAAFSAGLPVQLEGPALVSLFIYDNGTFIVESFRNEAVDIGLVVNGKSAVLRDAVSGAAIEGKPIRDFMGREAGKTTFKAGLKPHSFRVFRSE
jgi:hypothetical protein